MRHGHLAKTFVVGIMLVFAQAVYSQSSIVVSLSPNIPPPRTLQPSKLVVSKVPIFGTSESSRCDDSGNIFTEASDMLMTSVGPIIKITNDGSGHTIYPFPQKVNFQGTTSWNVTPGGIVYLLFGDFNTYQIMEFTSNGDIGKRVTLEIPSKVRIEGMAVADSGVVYIHGYQMSPDGSPSQGESMRNAFAALFSDSGKLIRLLTTHLSSDSQHIDLRILAQHPMEGDVAAGADGRFYVLEQNDVLVINQIGEIERTLKFQKPDPSAIAAQMVVSHGLVSITLDSIHREKPKMPAQISVHSLVLNAFTGELMGDYVFSSSQNNILCFNHNDGYKVGTVENGMDAWQLYPLQ